MNLQNDEATSRSIFAWNYFLWEVRLALVAIGFFLYLGIFCFSHFLSSWLSMTYRSLPAKEKVFWNLTATRGVFGIQSCVAGFWALLIDPVFQADIVYSQQDWSWFSCLIASGFFLLENVAVHVSNFIFKTFDFFVVVHHFLAFGGFLGLIINIKSGHYIPLMGMLLELSTPFTCMSWMLLKLRTIHYYILDEELLCQTVVFLSRYDFQDFFQNIKEELNSQEQLSNLNTAGRANTFFWKASQWIMVHMFHCRMMLTYHMWWVCLSHWYAVMENMGLLYFTVVLTGLSAVTFILNPYWTYKKTLQLSSPVDWNFSDRTMKNGSSVKVNGEALQKKRL